MKNRNRSNSSKSLRKSPLYKNQGFKMFVSNIPFKYNLKELIVFMKTNVQDVTDVHLYRDKKGNSNGCCTVEFKTKQSVRNAIKKLHHFDLNGRRLIAYEDNQQRDNRGCQISNNVPATKDQPVMRFTPNNSYRLKPEFLESLNIQPPLVNRVFVTNLHPKVDEEHLKEIFKLAGRIIGIQFSQPNSGYPFALIEYFHPLYAVQAIVRLNNVFIYNRPMRVCMDRFPRDPITNLLPTGLKTIGFGLGPLGNPVYSLDGIFCVSRNQNSSNMWRSASATTSNDATSSIKIEKYDENSSGEDMSDD